MSSPLTDKVALITGANAGIGYEVAASLARRGAHVLMACRNPERAEAARQRLLADAPDARATVLPLDLANAASIQSLGNLVGERVGQLDLVIHNAGVFGVPLARNDDASNLSSRTSRAPEV